MSALAATLLLFAAEGPVMIVSAPDAEYDIGFEELTAGQDRAALEAIENCRNLPADDPARQINHAIALARLGSTMRPGRASPLPHGMQNVSS